MSQVYETQSLLQIVCETGYSELASAAVKRINYKKPSGSTGFWPATVNGTTLTYNLANGDINQSGMWQFQAYIEIGGLKGLGEIDEKLFDIPIEL